MILNINLGGGSVEPELLWTNPAPYSEFQVQDVTVSDEYDSYLISVKYRTYAGEVVTSYVPKNASNFLVPAFWLVDNSSLNMAVREITSISGGVITFGWGKYGSSSITKNNGFGIPLAIWGVKGTI